jgi:hypothetical protein
MALRFQRRVRLFPGVRLNFSRSGVSTTIGVRGASVTVGPRGTHLNAGIPGTGLSSRTRLDAPAPAARRQFAYQNAAPVSQSRLTGWPSQEAATPIRSADVNELTSAGLGELKRLVNEAAVRRRALAATVAAETATLAKARARLRFARSFIVRIFTYERVPRLIEAAAAAESKLQAVQSELEACRVDVEFGLDEPALASYATLVNAFDALSECHAVWDVTASRATDQVEERTAAVKAISRAPVKLARAAPEIIGCSEPVLRFGNEAGRDIFIYPSFVMMTGQAGEVGLLEFGEVITSCSAAAVAETETVPPDAERIGETWAKANLDGSADRRFKDNQAIPLVRYGEIEMVSLSGFYEVYLASDFNRASAYVRAYLRHVAALADLARREPAAEAWPQPVEDDGEGDAGPPPPPEPAPWKPRLIGDWITLVGLVMALTYAVMAMMDARTPVPPPTPAKPVAAQVEKAAEPKTRPKASPRRRARPAEKPAAANAVEVAPPLPIRAPDDPAGIPY